MAKVKPRFKKQVTRRRLQDSLPPGLTTRVGEDEQGRQLKLVLNTNDEVVASAYAWRDVAKELRISV